MSTRAASVAAVLLLSVAAASAAPRPNIPSSEMPGRERERFIDPFPQPKTLAPPVVTPGRTTTSRKRACKRRKTC